MNQPIARVKLEILLDAPLAAPVIETIEYAGAKGYTLLPAVGGSGRNGRWREDTIVGADTKLLLMTIVSAEVANAILNSIRPWLDKYGMIVMTTQVGVSRGDRF